MGSAVGKLIKYVQQPFQWVIQAGVRLGEWFHLWAEPKKKYPKTNYSANYSGTSEPARLIYGTVKVGGMHTIPAFCTGNDGRNLHLVFSLCLGEVEEVSEYWVEQTKILPSDCSPVSGGGTDGRVNSGPYKDAMYIRPYKGTSIQTVDYLLTQAYPSAFTSDYRGRGVCYVALLLKACKAFDGVPLLTFTVKGRLVYDPRVPGMLSTATTNPALILRDYLVNEVGFPTSAIDDTLVIAAANICDQLVDIPPGSSQQKRYECSLMLSCADAWETNIGIILQTMAGKILYRDGQWRIFAGAWDTPTYTINPQDWGGEVQIRLSAPMEDRWNSVVSFYMDSARKYQRVPSYARRNTTYETADGERIPLEIEVQGATNEYHAQRIAEFQLRASRNQITVSGQLRPEFIKLSTWDTVYVTDPAYGWSAKTFRVMRMDMAMDGEVSVELREEGNASWTDLARAEYSAQITWVTIDPGASLPEERAGFTITPSPGALNFSWAVSSDTFPNEVTRLLQSSVSSDAAAATEIWRGNATGVNIPFTSVVTRGYWIQGVVGSYGGPYTPNTFGTWAAAQSGGTGTPGMDSLTAYLTNEYTSVPASSDGTVAAAAYSGVNGTMVLMLGINSVNANSITYSIQANSGTLTSVISPNGTYVVSGGLDTAEPYGALLLRGVYSGTNVDRWFKVGKNIGGTIGTNAMTLNLQSTSQVFRYSGSGTNIGVSTIGFDALLQNISGTVGFYANNYRADGTLINSVALSGAGNTGRGFHINSFTSNGSTAYATIVASISGGYTDQVTVVRVAEGASGSNGANGAPGLTGALSLVNFTIACDAGGTPKSGAFDAAVGQFTILSGATDVTNSCVFTNSRYGCSGSVNSDTNAPVTGAKGSYRITSVTTPQSYIAITATFSTQAITQNATFNCVNDGAAGGSGQDTSFLTVTSTAFGTGLGQAGVVSVAGGPGGHFSVSLNGVYKGTGTTTNIAINAKCRYRKQGDTTWTDITSAVGSGDTSIYGPPWEAAVVEIAPTSLTGPSSLTVYEFDCAMYKYGAATGMAWNTGPAGQNFFVQWTA